MSKWGKYKVDDNVRSGSNNLGRWKRYQVTNQEQQESDLTGANEPTIKQEELSWLQKNRKLWQPLIYLNNLMR